MLIVGVLIALGLFAILGAVFLMRAPISNPKIEKSATTPAIATETQPPALAQEPQNIPAQQEDEETQITATLPAPVVDQPVEDAETQIIAMLPDDQEPESVVDQPVEGEDETQETTMEISERPSIVMMPRVSQGHIVSSTQEDIMELLEEIHHLHKQSARIERRLIYITELIERMEPALIEATGTQQIL